MQHLEEGTIHAWLDGALTPLDAEQVLKHAAECAACAAMVAEARGMIAGAARIVSTLDDVPGGVLPNRATATAKASSVWSRLRLTPGRAALAATILLAVSTTLTLRSTSSSSSPSRVDSAVTLERAPSPVVPVVATAPLDSAKALATRVVNSAPTRKQSAAAPAPRTEPVAEQRAVADASTRRDTTAPRDKVSEVSTQLAKARAAAPEPVAGATVTAVPAASRAEMASNTAASGQRLEQRFADPTSAFEGCYRLSADSSSGGTEIPHGLPTSFSLSRPSADAPRMALRSAGGAARTDSSAPAATVWRVLSANQAHVTFAGGVRPVSLLLTAGSPVGVSSSGDSKTTVRVVRTACPR